MRPNCGNSYLRIKCPCHRLIDFLIPPCPCVDVEPCVIGKESHEPGYSIGSIHLDMFRLNTTVICSLRDARLSRYVVGVQKTCRIEVDSFELRPVWPRRLGANGWGVCCWDVEIFLDERCVEAGDALLLGPDFFRVSSWLRLR